MKKTNDISLSNFYAKRQRGLSGQNVPPRTPVGPIEFITSKEFLGIELFPFQRVVVKTVFGLWPSMPSDPEEEQFLKNMNEKWGITIDRESSRGVEQLVLVAGRRSGKTLVTSAMICYGVYSLLCKGNPQAHYHINQDQAIRFLIVACAENQAQEIFEHVARIIRGADFFQPYLDRKRNTKTELGLFTPYELQAFRAQGSRQIPGSIIVKSVPSVGYTNRGKAIYFLTLTEFGHMQRSGADESQQTDTALYKALAPSLKDFAGDGKIFMESSPRDAGGEFYDNFRFGGGGKRDGAAPVPHLITHQAIQAATWEANPAFTEESFEVEFVKDAATAEMEFGAHFGGPSSAFFAPDLIAGIIDPGVPFLSFNPGRERFYITLDMGGKAASADADAAVVAWGHREGARKWVDGLQTFRPRRTNDRGRPWEPVQPYEVLGFISSLVKQLGGNRLIEEVSFDQYESMMVAAHIRGIGVNPFETTFTNSRKRDIFDTFHEQIMMGNVMIRGGDPNGPIKTLREEFAVFQREVRGDKIFYHHPYIGPMQHDDHVVAVGLLIYRMSLEEFSTPSERFRERPVGGGPRIINTGGPLKGPSLWPRKPISYHVKKTKGRLPHS